MKRFRAVKDALQKKTAQAYNLWSTKDAHDKIS